METEGNTRAKPALAPKPRVTPKPFSLQQNASFRSIPAPNKSPTSAKWTRESKTTSLYDALSPPAQKLLYSTSSTNRSQLIDKDTFHYSEGKPDVIPQTTQTTEVPKPEPIQEDDIAPAKLKAKMKQSEDKLNKKENDPPVTPNHEEMGNDSPTQKHEWGGTRKRLSAALKSKFEIGGPPPLPQASLSSSIINTKGETKKPESTSTSLELSEEKTTPSNRENAEDDAKEDYTGGNSIKRRISLLFDSSSRPENLVKKEEPDLIHNIGDVKSRIKNWTSEKSSEPATAPTEDKTFKTAANTLSPTVDLPEQPAKIQAETHQELPEEKSMTTQVKLRNHSPSFSTTNNQDSPPIKSTMRTPKRTNGKRRSVRFGTVERDDGGPPLILGSTSESSAEEENDDAKEDETKADAHILLDAYKRLGNLQKKGDDPDSEEKDKLNHHEFEKRRRAEEHDQAKLNLEEELAQERAKQKEREELKLKEEERRRMIEREERERQLLEEQKAERLREQEREKMRLREEAIERERQMELSLQRQREEERKRAQLEEDKAREERERERLKEQERERERIREERERQRQREINLEKEREQERARQAEEDLRKAEMEKESLRVQAEERERRRRLEEEERMRQRLRREEEEERMRQRLRREEEEERMRQRLRREEEEVRIRKELERKMLQEQEHKLERQKTEEEIKRRQKELEIERKIKEEELERKQRELEIERIKREEELERMQMELEMERKRREEEIERKQLELEMERRKREEEMDRKQKELERMKREEEMERMRQIDIQMEVEQRRQIEEERAKEQEKVRQYEEEFRKKEEIREMLQREEEQRRKDMWSSNRVTEDPEDRKEHSSISLESERESEREPQRSKSPHKVPESISQLPKSPLSDVAYDDFSVRKPVIEVEFDDFSVKPRLRGTQPKVETPAVTQSWVSDFKENEEANLQMPLDIPLSIRTDNRELKQPQDNPKEEEDSAGEEAIVEKEQPTEKHLFFDDQDEGEMNGTLDRRTDQVVEEDKLQVEIDSHQIDDKDTEALIETTQDLEDVDSDQPQESESPNLIPDNVTEEFSEEPNTVDLHKEPELPPFPESITPLLDNSTLRSKVDLGRRRSRTRPTRSFRVGLDQADKRDWRVYDSSVEKSSSLKESESDLEDEQPKRTVSRSPSTSQKVSAVSGVSPAALIAQLKKRVPAGGTGRGEEREEDKSVVEKEPQDEEVAPSPSQLSRSPRSASRLAGAALVLPPLGSKDGGAIASPAWLKELKSKKRLSQHDSVV